MHRKQTDTFKNIRNFKLRIVGSVKIPAGRKRREDPQETGFASDQTEKQAAACPLSHLHWWLHIMASCRVAGGHAAANSLYFYPSVVSVLISFLYLFVHCVVFA